jgi:hypothetical protein
MSLLGKVFAILNLVGLVGLTFLGLLVYNKAKSYTYAVYIRQLTLKGLPLDKEERDVQDRPLYQNVTTQAQADLFGADVKDAVSTQAEEVDRVQKYWQSKIGGQEGDAAKARLLADLLLPLARSSAERERLIAVRTHLADDQAVKELKKQMREGVRPGLQIYAIGYDATVLPPGLQAQFKAQLQDELKRKSLTFAEGYAQALEAQRGTPGAAPNLAATALTLLQSSDRFYKDLPTAAQKLSVARGWIEPTAFFQAPLLKAMGQAKSAEDAAKGIAPALVEKNDGTAERDLLRAGRGEAGKTFAKLFDDSFDDALKAVQEDLQEQFDRYFKEILEGVRQVDGQASKLTAEERRVAAAALLFSLAEADMFLNPGEGEAGGPPTDDPLSLPRYRRVRAVVGLRMFLRTLSDQAQRLDRISAELDKAISAERDAFAAVHQHLLTAVKNRAVDLELDEKQLQTEMDKVAAAQGLVDAQKKRVGEY